MTLDEYQDAAASTAGYAGEGTMWGLSYVTIKGSGESGEFAEKIGKRVFRDGWEPSDSPLRLSDEVRNDLALEIGDNLWYLAMQARELGYTLSKVAEMNVNKLAERKKAGGLLGERVPKEIPWEPCPECGAVTCSAGPGGGVKCTRCSWWFCY